MELRVALGEEALEREERLRILAALDRFEWNRGVTARALEIERSTLYLKMRKYRLLTPASVGDTAAPPERIGKTS